MCNDGWLQGWHERNGGNLTYRLRPEEVEQCRPYMNTLPGGWVKMGVQADNLRGEYFLATGSGKYYPQRRSRRPRTIFACWRSTTPGTAGASSGAWRRADGPPASSPAIS